MTLCKERNHVDQFGLPQNWPKLFRKEKYSHLAMLLMSVAVSACGGGGGGATSAGNTTSNQSSNTSGSQSLATVFSGSVSLPPAGNALTITKSGSKYLATDFAGLTLLDESSKIKVADDTSDNSYSVKLNAVGAGLLEFNFDDQNDSIKLLDGSTISGFSQLKILNGTVDTTKADLDVVNYISIASSVKISVSQLNNIKTIVSNGSDGVIEVEVSSDAEADKLKSLITNGDLKIHASTTPVKVIEKAGSSVTASKLADAASAITQNLKTVASLQITEITTQSTVLDQRTFATLSIANNDRYVNVTEATENLKINVNTEDKYTVKSVKFDGVSASSGANTGEYVIGLTGKSDGTYDLVAEVQDALGTVATLEAKVVIDKTVPGTPTVAIIGEANGINAVEASQPLQISVISETGSSVRSIKFNGVNLAGSEGEYSLDASNFANGEYSIDVVIEDAAGNQTNSTKTFTLDTTAAKEAKISIAGSENGLNKTEVSGLVTVDIDLQGATGISSAKIGSKDLTLVSGNKYTFDASNLAEGTHTVTVLTTGTSGETLTSTSTFKIDKTEPSAAEVVIVSANGGLTPSELVEPVDVVIIPDIGASLVSAKVGSVSLNKMSGTLYNFNASSLAGGKHEVEVITQDQAGNQTITTEEFTVLGFSNVGSNIFDIKSSATGDVIKFDVSVKNILNVLPDGIPSYDFSLKLNPNELDFAEGSFRGSPGAIYSANQSASSSGVIKVGGFYQRPYEQYDEIFFSFSATKSSNLRSAEILFENTYFGAEDLGSLTYFVEI